MRDPRLEVTIDVVREADGSLRLLIAVDDERVRFGTIRPEDLEPFLDAILPRDNGGHVIALR